MFAITVSSCSPCDERTINSEKIVANFQIPLCGVLILDVVLGITAMSQCN